MLNKHKRVENTPRNRLYNALLTLNFLHTNEIEITAGDRQWIIEKSSELNKPVYFKDVLTSQWKSGDVLCWGRGFVLVYTGVEKLQIPSKLIKIHFEKEKSLEKEK